MILIDNEAEKAGEYVKNYISWVRSWKSAQGIALNASMQSSATYSTKSIISKIKPSGSIIKSTLNYPDDHEFIVGKPDVEEKITSVKPVHSKIGPLFKKESGKLTKWIGEHQDELIKTIEGHGDVRWSEIPIVDKKTPDEPLIKNGYIQVKKETKVKGKKDKGVLQFDDFYIEVSGDMIK
jgi:valyl-tRNA synthetase